MVRFNRKTKGVERKKPILDLNFNFVSFKIRKIDKMGDLNKNT